MEWVGASSTSFRRFSDAGMSSGGSCGVGEQFTNKNTAEKNDPADALTVAGVVVVTQWLALSLVSSRDGEKRFSGGPDDVVL